MDFTRRLKGNVVCLSLIGIISLPGPAVGDEGQSDTQRFGDSLKEQEQEVRLYRTRKERREAGLHRPITPWLVFSGLAELEVIREDFTFEDEIESLTEIDRTANVQLGLVATPLDWLEGELIVEYDSQPNEIFLEELTVAADYESWELLLGKQYLPFGKYFSNFVTGPILEIGETRETAATLTYDFFDRFEFSVSVYEGVARQIDSDEKIDWAISMGAVFHERLGMGFSYLTDLGDAGGRLLEDQDNRFIRKVPGLSGYIVWVGDNFDTTFEFVGAQRSFEEFEIDRDQPLAWNLESAISFHSKYDIAVRIEGSRELEGFPEIQFGLATTVSLHPQATLTLELLHGRFKSDFATDDADNSFGEVTTVGAQLSIAF